MRTAKDTLHCRQYRHPHRSVSTRARHRLRNVFDSACANVSRNRIAIVLHPRIVETALDRSDRLVVAECFRLMLMQETLDNRFADAILTVGHIEKDSAVWNYVESLDEPDGHTGKPLLDAVF